MNENKEAPQAEAEQTPEQLAERERVNKMFFDAQTRGFELASQMLMKTQQETTNEENFRVAMTRNYFFAVGYLGLIVANAKIQHNEEIMNNVRGGIFHDISVASQNVLEDHVKEQVASSKTEN